MLIAVAVGRRSEIPNTFCMSYEGCGDDQAREKAPDYFATHLSLLPLPL
jgi:hypothetical protein